MNPSLVQSIRERLDGKSTEDLLELWVTNDRVMWSSEMFQAVRSLLAERGVKELPQQSEPAALAARYSPAELPIDEYWLGWLRPVMWISIAIAGVGLVQGLLLVTFTILTAPTVPISFHDLTLPHVILELLVILLVLPVWLGVAAAGVLHRRRWARPALLWYVVVAATAVVSDSLLKVMEDRPLSNDMQTALVNIAWQLDETVKSLLLPAVLWVLLRRPEIRSAFDHARVGSGFEPNLTEDTRAAAHHR